MFNNVKISEQIEIAKGCSSIPYQEYVSLVQKVVANYDNHLKVANPPRNKKSMCISLHMTITTMKIISMILTVPMKMKTMRILVLSLLVQLHMHHPFVIAPHSLSKFGRSCPRMTRMHGISSKIMENCPSCFLTHKSPNTAKDKTARLVKVMETSEPLDPEDFVDAN